MSNLLETLQRTVTATDFFNKLFEIRDTIHFTHLYQPDETLATHLALGEIYEGILPIIDGIVEGISGRKGVKFKLSVTARTTDNPLEYLESAYAYISMNRHIFTDSWVQNELDTIAKLLSVGLYKLRFVR